MSNQLFRFPQGPLVDKNGYVTLEWQQWFQNPQFVTAKAGTLYANNLFNQQTNLAYLAQDGEDGEDGISVQGKPGENGINGANGAPGMDGQDGEDYSFYGIPSTLNLTSLTLSGNGYANDFSISSASTATSGGTTTLSVTSAAIQVFTGASNQTLALPNATTLINGKRFWVNNNASGSITIKDNGGTTIYTLPAGGYVQINLLSNGTSAGTWDVHPLAPSTVTWGSGITGLVFNSALATTPSINAGASSASSPSFIPQRASSTTGYGGDSTHLYGSIGGSAVFTATSTNFTLPAVNKVTITTPATGSTLTIADGKTLTANNSIAFSGTDSTTMTFPSTSATIARTDAAQTFTGTQTIINNLNVGRGAATTVIQELGNPSNAIDGASRLLFQNSNSTTNWEVANNLRSSGALDFTPSTAGGGTTFSTPVFRLTTSGGAFTGSLTSSTGFGCNGASAQTSYASGGALAAYAGGANGLDTAAHMQSLYNLVVAMRAALVANGIMS